ncbi:MAG: hypothetical protein Q8P18_33270 [Pseudomonadota bacterium]|nr:hypothetical protein [Pseudomonadota bacterium]
MNSPYEPYASLQSLLDAAGVTLDDMPAYSRTTLLRMAKERHQSPLAVAARSADPALYGGPPYATKSIRLPYALATDLDRKARLAGSNFNTVVTLLCKRWMEE